MHPYVNTAHNSQDMEITKCPWTDEWIKKMWYIYILLWNSTQPFTKNKIIPLAGTQMELEIIILSEVSQGKTDTI